MSVLSSNGVKRNLAEDMNSPQYLCFGQKIVGEWNLDRCERAFARPRLKPSSQRGAWGGIAEVMIPTFQLKVLSQFDFIKQGGLLVENPLLQRSLKNLTFTWDLKHLIPSTTDRLTIATMYEQAKKPEKPKDDSKASKLCIIHSGTSTSYISVDDKSSSLACKRVAVDLVADGYGVGCAKTKSAIFGTLSSRRGNDFENLLESQFPKPDCGWINNPLLPATTPASGSRESKTNQNTARAND